MVIQLNITTDQISYYGDVITDTCIEWCRVQHISHELEWFFMIPVIAIILLIYKLIGWHEKNIGYEGMSFIYRNREAIIDLSLICLILLIGYVAYFVIS